MYNFPVQIAGQKWRVILSPDRLADGKEVDVDVPQQIIWMSPDVSIFRHPQCAAQAVSVAWDYLTKNKKRRTKKSE